jgi:hypothetical protein
MARYVADSKYIASIFPGNLDRIKLYHGVNPKPGSGRATVYCLPPVPREGRPVIPEDLTNVKHVKQNGRHFVVLEVSDAFENILNPLKSAESGTRVWDSGPVPCEEIIGTLMKHWTGNMVGVPPGATPGVMVINNSTPSQDETAIMLRAQNAFYEYMFQEGERLARENDWKHITDNMRDACDWLGHKRNWAHPGNSQSTINCPECKQPILADANVCHHCRTRLRPVSPELAALQPAG